VSMRNHHTSIVDAVRGRTVPPRRGPSTTAVGGDDERGAELDSGFGAIVVAGASASTVGGAASVPVEFRARRPTTRSSSQINEVASSAHPEVEVRLVLPCLGEQVEEVPLGRDRHERMRQVEAGEVGEHDVLVRLAP
jgi:hypothetical protein